MMVLKANPAVTPTSSEVFKSNDIFVSASNIGLVRAIVKSTILCKDVGTLRGQFVRLMVKTVTLVS